MKKQVINKVSKKDGYSRAFEFKLLEIKRQKTERFNAYAKYEVDIAGIKDEYHTTYLNPTAEPENGYHTNQFNKYYDLENEVMNVINEHLWDVCDETYPELLDTIPAYVEGKEKEWKELGKFLFKK